MKRSPSAAPKTLRKSADDAAAVVAAGITLHEAHKRTRCSRPRGFPSGSWTSIQSNPVDAAGLRAAAAARNRIIVVEDHYAGGGLGDAVASTLAGRTAITHLHPGDPCSGKPAELLDRFGISARRIVEAVKSL